jgi:DNA polymerase-3 subunit gamma/tau
MDHGAGNLVPVFIWGLFVVVAIRRWFKRSAPPPAPPRPAVASIPVAQMVPAPVRRRLAPPAAPRSIPAQTFAAPPPSSTQAPPPPPTMGQTLPAEAAAAFPALDLSLPDTPGVPAAARRRRVRTIGGGAAFGSPGWAANAIVANEILGTPVGLRPGATVGIPHAF